MHELGLVQEVIDVCAARAEGARVRRVVLEVGKLAAVLPAAMRFCFELVAAESALAGAELEIVEVAGTGRCRGCGATVEMEGPLATCGRCGGSELDWLSGEELRIREMEVV
jgi:hydrogenase nickel incorporation protein HypA/HybF